MLYLCVSRQGQMLAQVVATLPGVSSSTLNKTLCISRSKGTVVSSNLWATASEFAPVPTGGTCLLGGAILSMKYSLPQVSSAVSSADVNTNVTATTSGLSLFLSFMSNTRSSSSSSHAFCNDDTHQLYWWCISNLHSVCSQSTTPSL